MEADVLNALQRPAAHLTGGRDRDGRPIILVPVPNEAQQPQPWTKKNLELAIKYMISTLKWVFANKISFLQKQII